MSDEETVERKDGLKDGTERRVYNLPANLLIRLRAFQASQGLTSEAEAARRLLDFALQMRDSVEDILRGMRKRFDEEKELRVLASETLTRHSLVTHIVFENDAVWFRVKNGEKGKIESSGALYTGGPDYPDDHWDRLINAPALKKPVVPTWDAPGGSDLDDEPPF